MTKEDALTMKAVLLYIIKNSSEDKRDVYCVIKTAYYAQQLHFAKWALPIFKDKICSSFWPGSLINVRYSQVVSWRG